MYSYNSCKLLHRLVCTGMRPAPTFSSVRMVSLSLAMRLHTCSIHRFRNSSLPTTSGKCCSVHRNHKQCNRQRHSASSLSLSQPCDPVYLFLFLSVTIESFSFSRCFYPKPFLLYKLPGRRGVYLHALGSNPKPFNLGDQRP